MQPPWTFGARHAAVSDHSFDMNGRRNTAREWQHCFSSAAVFKNHRLPIAQVSRAMSSAAHLSLSWRCCSLSCHRAVGPSWWHVRRQPKADNSISLRCRAVLLLLQLGVGGLSKTEPMSSDGDVVRQLQEHVHFLHAEYRSCIECIMMMSMDGGQTSWGPTASPQFGNAAPSLPAELRDALLDRSRRIQEIIVNTDALLASLPTVFPTAQEHAALLRELEAENVLARADLQQAQAESREWQTRVSDLLQKVATDGFQVQDASALVSSSAVAGSSGGTPSRK
jgi:hypothetical protein